jgi:hypothetical protein
MSNEDMKLFPWTGAQSHPHKSVNGGSFPELAHLMTRGFPKQVNSLQDVQKLVAHF